MAEEHLDIEVSGDAELSEIEQGLKYADRQIPKEVQDEIFRHARFASEEAKELIKGMPTEGNDHDPRPLRKDIARGVKLVRRPDGVTVQTSMPEEDEAIIPLGFDTRKGWRHPVFGNREEWVRQHGSYSWFMEPMQDMRAPLTDSIEDVLDDIADSFRGGTY